jgi:hypothetical protein
MGMRSYPVNAAELVTKARNARIKKPNKPKTKNNKKRNTNKTLALGDLLAAFTLTPSKR